MFHNFTYEKTDALNDDRTLPQLSSFFPVTDVPMSVHNHVFGCVATSTSILGWSAWVAPMGCQPAMKNDLSIALFIQGHISANDERHLSDDAEVFRRPTTTG